MATSRTPDEMLQDYTAAMGPKLGPAFHRLYNDNAWLHMKWNEFLKLFVKSPAQMRDLNTAAPGFFPIKCRSSGGTICCCTSSA